MFCVCLWKLVGVTRCVLLRDKNKDYIHAPKIARYLAAAMDSKYQARLLSGVHIDTFAMYSKAITEARRCDVIRGITVAPRSGQDAPLGLGCASTHAHSMSSGPFFLIPEGAIDTAPEQWRQRTDQILDATA